MQYEKKKPEKGIIKIDINSLSKSIKIEDNGSGIDPEMLPILLAPFSTNKENDEDSIGEKGVGLTFVLFSCNDFKITSGNQKGTLVGCIKDANN
ncbi:ATP-binding protein [Flavobacterium sp. ASV13]|uniref:ATP-binding protein n=1 Tax=Flavobacterium sp. ASV13 TaxID=1506583 RepID=UPI000ADEE1FB|nr:ATP-binding protein [Flavobacterium sp. ASV13]